MVEVLHLARKDVTSKYINGDYLLHNPTWDIEHSPRKARELRSIIPNGCLEEMFSRSRYVVEVGCGAGGVLFEFNKILRKEGVYAAPVGYDISPQAIEMAREKFGSEARFVNSAEIDIKGRAAVVLLVDVLEHLDDPDAFLQSLKDRSAFFIIRLPLDLSLWNICLGKLPSLTRELGHIHFYNYKSALELVNSQGLEVLRYMIVNNFSDPANRRTVVSKFVYPIRSLISAASRSLNSRLLGGNSIVILAAPSRRA